MADKLKNLLLAVLVLLMLGLVTGTFLISVRGDGAGLRLSQESDAAEGETVLRAAALPETVTVLKPEGAWLALEENRQELLYQQLEPLFQEAVGSAGGLEPITGADWLSRLEGTGILLQYHVAQPLYLLQDWGGGEALREDIHVCGAAMVAGEERVELLLTDREGGCWRAETAASLAELESLCASVEGTNARLTRQSRQVAADTVLTTGVTTCGILTIAPLEAASRGELSQSVQSLLGMNPYLTRVYQSAEGSLVYVEGRSTLSLSPEGDLHYDGAEGIGLELTEEGTARKAQLCRQVCDLLYRLWEQTGASGALSLEEVRLEADSGTLWFGLRAGTLFAERREGSWATVVVENGAVTGLTAALRLLEETGTVSLLPMTQAEAALPQGRAALRLRLLEQADGTLLPEICSVTEE